MIKVLHIYNNLDVAGAQTVIMNYLRYLKGDNEIEISLLINGLPKNTAYELECQEQGYSLIYSGFQAWKGIWGVRAIVNWFKCQWYVFREIKRLKPDVIHTHGTDNLLYFTLPILFAGVKGHIHTLHSDPYTFRKIFVIWAYIAFHWIGVFPICVTKEQAQKARQRYKIKKYTVIYNGIDSNRFINVNKTQVRQELDIPETKTVIGCVARFEKIKNHQFLIQLFSEYSKSNNNAILMLVGEGAERKTIEQLAAHLGIKEKLIFTGMRKDVERLYYAMDIFMLTSFYESSSIVTIEAQMAGVRCVIANSIPEDTVITNQVNRISLDAPTPTWIAAIRNEIPYDKPKSSISDFTIENTINSTKKIYLLISSL